METTDLEQDSAAAGEICEDDNISQASESFPRARSRA